MKPIFDGFVKGGRLVLKDEERFADYVKTFEGRCIEVTIDKPHDERTLQQLRYLFGVCYKLIADDIGEADVYKVHRMLMQELSPSVVSYVDKRTGEIMFKSVGKSSTNFSVEDMAEYIDKVIQWSVEFLGVVIPDANKVKI